MTQVEAVPLSIRHQRVHAGHNTFVHPDEWQFVTTKLTERLFLAGTVEEIVVRILSYEAVGLDELLLLPDLEHRDADTDAFARQVLPELRSV